MIVSKVPYFNFAALAVLVVIILSEVFRKTKGGKSAIFFMILNLEIMITTVFDIYAVYYDNLGAGNVMEKWVFHGGYLICHTASALFYLFYIISLTDTYFRFRNSVGRTIGIFTPMLIYLAVFFAGFHNNFPIYYINENDVYTRGPALVFGYIIGGFYLLYGIVYIMKYRKMFSKRFLSTLFSFYPLVLVAMIVEYINPTIIIELFANALSMLFIALHIQKPEELNEPISALGNTVALDDLLRRNFLNEKAFADVIIEIKNYSSTMTFLNYDHQILLRSNIGKYIRSLEKKYKLYGEYFIGDVGRYHIIIPESSFNKIEELGEELLERFNGMIMVDDAAVSGQSAICVATYPGDFGNFDSFRRFISSDMTTFSTDEVIYAKDLLKREFYKVSMDVDKIIGEAISHERMQIFYQPIYSVDEKKFVAAEALMRISDPLYGMVSPAIFIPAAERSGAIYKLWDYAINEVCRFIASDAFKHCGIKFIDINMSAVQCMKTNLAEETIATIDRYGIPHDTINIEITETAFAYDKDMLLENARKLHEAGIAISLDDYGTGYSDISRVLSLPLKLVKLDRSFVLFANDDKRKSVVGNTINMFKDVNMDIIAEGVEDKTLIEELTKMGCSTYQGWYYSKALPERSFIKFIEESNNKKKK